MKNFQEDLGKIIVSGLAIRAKIEKHLENLKDEQLEENPEKTIALSEDIHKVASEMLVELENISAFSKSMIDLMKEQIKEANERMEVLKAFQKTLGFIEEK